MSFLDKIHLEVLKAFGITAQIWAWLGPQIGNGVAHAVAAAMPIVEPIVIGLVSDPTQSGVEKAKAAFNAAKPQLVAAGLNASTNVVILAIESAVAKLPKDATTVAPAIQPVANS